MANSTSERKTMPRRESVLCRERLSGRVGRTGPSSSSGRPPTAPGAWGHLGRLVLAEEGASYRF